MNYIEVGKFNDIRTITFNRPNKKNALNSEGYIYLTNILNQDATDDSIIITIITGNGEYFSSGNDVSAAMQHEYASTDEYINESNKAFKNFVIALLNYPKLLIAVVNGPAIGIAVTMLALVDVVYASDRATFLTPFVKLGIVAEACSTFTFQNIMGKSKASEMLYLGHKMSAQEAYDFNFISKIIPHANLQSFIEDLKKHKLPVTSLRRNKGLVQRPLKNILNECNEIECTELRQALTEEDFANAIMAFMSRKSKL